MTRILLVGSDNLVSYSEDRVLKCYPWNKLSSIQNMSDFDVVIVNFLTLGQAKKINLEAFSKIFNIRNMADVLRHKGKLVLVGDLTQSLDSEKSSETVGSLAQRMQQAAATSCIHWTKIGLMWDDRPGASIVDIIEERRDSIAFGRYLSHLSKWDMTWKDINPDRDALAQVFDIERIQEFVPGGQLIWRTKPFYQSRYGTTVAGAVIPVLAQVDRNLSYQRFGGPSIEVVEEYGPLIILPEVDLPADEAIQILLEDLCELDVETHEPEWVKDMTAVGQHTIDAELDLLNETLVIVHQQMAKKREERDLARAPLKLLYSQHKDLEIVVRDVLKKLGARIELSDNSRDDGWITVDVDGGEPLHFVLEVKGTANDTFSEYGLKQLHGWVSDGIEEREIKAKGVFVGNSAISVPPDQRPWPFSDSFRRSAEMRELVVMRSEDLKSCLDAVLQGSLDAMDFWVRLKNKVGIMERDQLLTGK